MKKHKKTNVMRLLDQAGIGYDTMRYDVDESDLSGVHVAEELGEDPARVFKTLVLEGARTGAFVCCIPIAASVDLKKAAAAAGDKKAEMLPLRKLTPLTGYVRGGCSPVGMKKAFPTFIDNSALAQDTIAVSAGERGLQVIVNPQALAGYLGATFEALTKN